MGLLRGVLGALGYDYINKDRLSVDKDGKRVESIKDNYECDILYAHSNFFVGVGWTILMMDPL